LYDARKLQQRRTAGAVNTRGKEAQLMREIKFRAWSNKNKRMVDLYKITPLALDAALNMDGLFLPFTPELILMQFTGLKDKNGTEIYEGDLLSHKYYSRPIQVTFSDGCFESEDVDIRDRSLAVIGNIHQNPELLKAQL
jgi:hypothetical protein